MEIVYYFECLEMKKSNTGEQVKKKQQQQKKNKRKKMGVWHSFFFKTGSSNSLYQPGPPYRGKQIQRGLKGDTYPICYLLTNKFLEFSQTHTDEDINTFVLY